MKALLRRTLELKKFMTDRDYETTSTKVMEPERELDEFLSVDTTEFNRKERAFVNRLLKHGDSVFTFPYHPDVPPDNNGSERAIRNVKVKTKVSGQFRNGEGKGADRFARIRSIVDTAIKNGQEACGSLQDLAKCRSS